MCDVSPVQPEKTINTADLAELYDQLGMLLYTRRLISWELQSLNWKFYSDVTVYPALFKNF